MSDDRPVGLSGGRRPVVDGPVLATAAHLSGDDETAGDDFAYARFGTPTTAALEAELGRLHGTGPAVAFSSGTAALDGVLETLLSPGDRLVVPADGYAGTRALARGWSRWGVRVDEVATAGLAGADLGVRAVVLETPSNPYADVCDVAEVCRVAHAAGAVVVADVTTLTPLGAPWHDLGVDVTTCADTKFTAGHSDVLAGHVASRDADLLARVREGRTRRGPVPGSADAWLVLRGLATLEVRLQRVAVTAPAVADALRGHPAVRLVRHPTSATDPSAVLHAAQARWGGPLVTLEVDDRETAEAVVRALRVVREATSFGGVRTTVDRRERWDPDLPPGLLRVSVGLEDPDVLVDDLRRALDATRR